MSPWTRTACSSTQASSPLHTLFQRALQGGDQVPPSSRAPAVGVF